MAGAGAGAAGFAAAPLAGLQAQYYHHHQQQHQQAYHGSAGSLRAWNYRQQQPDGRSSTSGSGSGSGSGTATPARCRAETPGDVVGSRAWSPPL